MTSYSCIMAERLRVFQPESLDHAGAIFAVGSRGAVEIHARSSVSGKAMRIDVAAADAVSLGQAIMTLGRSQLDQRIAAEAVPAAAEPSRAAARYQEGEPR